MMIEEIRIEDDLDAMSGLAADLIANRAAIAVADHGTFWIAMSGGSTPVPLFHRLAEHTTFPWNETVIFQVDERLVGRESPTKILIVRP